MQQRISSAFVIAGLWFVFASGVSGQAKGKPSSPPVPVATTVGDFNGPSALLFQSDGSGAYEGSSEIVSQISGVNGDWELDLSAQTDRTVRLTFDSVSGSARSWMVSTTLV